MLFGLLFVIFPASSYASDDFNIDVPFNISDFDSIDDYLTYLNDYLSSSEIVPYGSINTDLNVDNVSVSYYSALTSFRSDESFLPASDFAYTKTFALTNLTSYFRNSNQGTNISHILDSYFNPLWGYTVTYQLKDDETLSNFTVVFDLDFSGDTSYTVNNNVALLSYDHRSPYSFKSVTSSTLTDYPNLYGSLVDLVGAGGSSNGNSNNYIVGALHNTLSFIGIDTSGSQHDLGVYTDTTGGTYKIKLPKDVDFTSLVFDMSYYYSDNNFSPSSKYLYYVFPYMYKADFSGSITLDDSGVISGLISSIIEWLKSILNAIKALPQQIADLVVEGIKTLFVPSSDDIMVTFDSLKVVAENKLGFLYTIFNMVYDLFNSLISGVISPSDTITIPRFAFPFSFVEGGEIVLWEEMTFNILPDGLSDFLNIIRTVTSILLITATMSHCVEYLRAFFRKE